MSRTKRYYVDARKCNLIHHAELLNQSVRLVISERGFCENVSDLPGFPDNLDLDPWVKINPVKQRMEINELSLENMSHGRIPHLNDDEDNDCIVVFKSEQGRQLAGILSVWRIKINAFNCQIPQNLSQRFLPILDQRQMKFSLLRCCYVKKLSASCKTNQLAQNMRLPKIITFRETLIQNWPGHLRNQNLESDAFCTIMLCFPHDKTVCTELVNWEIRR